MTSSATPKPNRNSIETVDVCLTDKVALAAYLMAVGYEVKLEFRFVEAGLQHDIDEFEAAVSRVEPGAYEAARNRLQSALEAVEGGAS